MMHALHLAIILGLAVSLLPGGTPPRPREDPVPEAEVPAQIPDQERRRENTAPAFGESIERGELQFHTLCISCHGVTGDGQGELAEKLSIRPTDFTDPEGQARRTDGELFYILTHGHGQMPGQGEQMPERSKWDLINYLRTLAKRTD
jgi:mono/diheme cytochrome c family protein